MFGLLNIQSCIRSICLQNNLQQENPLSIKDKEFLKQVDGSETPIYSFLPYSVWRKLFFLLTGIFPKRTSSKCDMSGVLL